MSQAEPDAASEAAASDAAASQAAASGEGAQVASERPRGLSVLLVLALVWLAGTLWAAYRTVAGAPTGTSIAVAQAAISLPTVAAASLLAGAAVGLPALAAVVGRRGAATVGSGRLARRALVGGVAAAPVGLVGVLAVVAAYGTGRFIIAIAGTVGIAALLGGGLCVVRPVATAAAGLAGTIATLAVGFVKGVFAGRLSGLFGAGDTAASVLNADATLQLTVSVLSGVAAGLTAFWFLRRFGAALRWPAYLVAGGFAGLILLVAELVVRVGGARLLSVAEATSPADRAVLEYLGSQRLNHALAVFFVGAVVSLVAVGRTLPAKAAG